MQLRLLVVSLLVLVCIACSKLDVNEPVELAWDKTGQKTDSVIIFLPGIYDSAETFKDEQFFSLARKAGIKADMVAASIHLGHLIKQKMITRIEKDVFNHLKENGYKNIWFVGMSLGALNSLLFYQRHYEKICGVVTLSPYLADDDLTSELKQAGSLGSWVPKSSTSKKVVKQKLRSLWAWLKQQKADKNFETVYLGYGKQDKFLESIKIFKNILKTKNIIEVEGKHDWKTGRIIWQQQLATMSQTGLLKPCR